MPEVSSGDKYLSREDSFRHGVGELLPPMVSSRFWLAAVLTAVNVSAFAETRILPAGELPHDTRLQPLKDLDGYFPFTPPKSREAWAERAEQVRTRLRVALGLFPEPTRIPLNAVIHGRIDHGDYTVEKVYFESMPGFYVTGNLYRPKNATGRSPGILCAHGHTVKGRFMEADDKRVKQDFATGAEKLENAARSPHQARGAQLARMGCVAFLYDMMGYADSTQISFEIAHQFAKQRPEMNSPTAWGLYSPQAEAYAQSVMGLQTWNSIRALDFLTALPDVDPERIAVNGGSGGGTQTMILGALDNRVKVAFPAVMVSTAMQGGCTCENASLLRISTGNVEFAGLFAPKPMAMTAADDWTREMETKGFPELKQLWSLLGAPDNVSLTALLQFPHNYNAPSRAAMYAWVNKHLGLNLSAEKLVERDFQRLAPEEMSVWNAEHPAPPSGADFERKLLQWWREDSDRQIKNASSADIRRAVATAIGSNWEETGDLQYEARSQRTSGGYEVSEGLLRNKALGSELPTLHLLPQKRSGAVVLWLDERGKAGLFGEGDQLRPEVRSLLDAGTEVIGVDLLYQGEFLTGDEPAGKTRRVKSPREAAAYTFGYNHSVFAQRTQDVLNALRFAQSIGGKSRPVGIIAAGSTGPIAAAARAIAPAAVGATALGSADFRFLNVSDLHDPSFQPALARYGDLPGLLALGGSSPVRFIGTATSSAGADSVADRRAAVDWLKEQLKPAVTH